MIRDAQHADGYINSYYTVRGIEQRWTNLRDMHELYCLGHLVEACVAYETLTGRSGRLLDPVMKALRHVDSLFGVEAGKKRGYPGHEEIEVGLLRLYELTQEELCLKLARYFIGERGTRDANDEIYFDIEARARGSDPYDHMGPDMRAQYQHPRDYAYHQADRPLREASEVQGHAVRAMYLYTAATDLARLTSDAPLHSALERLWTDLVASKLYVTGGVGAVRQWEGFGPRYLLGDVEEDGTCYAETCATFALVLWCQRLLRGRLSGEVADVMETALYNGFLGAMGAEGESFYYTNPLRTRGAMGLKERNSWFEVACCPPNVAKLLGLLGTLVYGYCEERNVVALHMLVESTYTVPGTGVGVSVKTNMPWSGEVEITVEHGRERSGLTLAVHVPGWCRGVYTVKPDVEGMKVEDGYLYLPLPTESSASKTTIELSFSMEPTKLYANPRTGKHREVCVVRGPLVYCVEDVDNPEIDVDNVALLARKPLTLGKPVEFPGFAGEVVTIMGTGRELGGAAAGTDEGRDGNADASGARGVALYSTEPWTYGGKERDVLLIPFFARANRGGRGGMRVWCDALL